VYNEYIQDRDHTHMNSTQWLTLTDFVKWMGREGEYFYVIFGHNLGVPDQVIHVFMSYLDPRWNRREATVHHPFFLHNPPNRRKFHAQSFFPRTTSLWNKLPRTCFPTGYSLKLFRLRVNKHLSSQFSNVTQNA